MGEASTSLWSIQEQTDPRPQKGNAAVLVAAERLVDVHPWFVIVIDTDRTPTTLGLPRNAEPARVRRAIEARFEAKGSRTPIICPLDRNTETVVVAAAQVLGEPPPQRKEKPLDRDRRLIRLARREDPSTRMRLLELVPSVADLVRELGDLLRSLEVERALRES